MEHLFFLRQPPAIEIAEKLARVVSEISPKSSITNFTLTTNVGDIDFLGANANVLGSNLDQHGLFKAGQAFLKDRPFLDVTGGGVNTHDGYSIGIRTDRGGFHFVLNTTSPRERNPQLTAPVADALNKHFNLFRQAETSASFIPDQEQSALKTAQTILLEFASQAARLSQLSADNTEKMNQIIIQKTAALEQLYEKKNASLDEAHQKKTKELSDEREAFAKDKAKFDARENTVVRRDLLGKIQAIIENQKKIEITTDTLSKRKPVGYVCSALFSLSVLLLALFGYKIFTETSPAWFHIAPFSTGVLLFISTAIFYIRWNDQWFKEHANAEFENRKFSRDIVRASWIAELLFEWKEKKEVPFPDQLISSYTTGLFNDSDVVKTTKHPFDDLKSLAGSVSEIKFSEKGGLLFKKKPGTEEK